MAKKGTCSGGYEVAVTYRGLTSDELHELFKLYETGKLYGNVELDPIVGRDYITDCDGFSEPSNTWNVKFFVDQCDGITKDAWEEWYGSETLKSYDIAEKIRETIKNETGIE